MRRAIVIALCSSLGSIMLPTPTLAQTQDLGASAPVQRVRSVTLTAGQKCPQSTGNEVVVCHTLEQPYRIPKAFRDDQPVAAANQSWVNRAATVDQVSRTAGGLPDTCSPIGSGGQTGCALAANSRWAAERRQQQIDASRVP